MVVIYLNVNESTYMEVKIATWNINSLRLESTNFSLNDDDFTKIKEISNGLESQTLILFWQFTIKTLEELDIVSNQNLSIEMFLIRMIPVSYTHLTLPTTPYV